MLDAFAIQYPVLYGWFLLPLLILISRCVDMSLSTLRISFIAQGRTAIAATVGFFEALIWLFVIGQIMRYLDNPACVFAYAAGFALGNVTGLALERRLAIGTRIVRVITQQEAERLVVSLRRAGFGVTAIDGEGVSGPVKVLFTVVRRRNVPAVLERVRRHSPHAFVSVEDVREAAAGTIPHPRRRTPWRLPLALRKSR